MALMELFHRMTGIVDSAFQGNEAGNNLKIGINRNRCFQEMFSDPAGSLLSFVSFLFVRTTKDGDPVHWIFLVIGTTSLDEDFNRANNIRVNKKLLKMLFNYMKSHIMKKILLLMIIFLFILTACCVSHQMDSNITIQTTDIPQSSLTETVFSPNPSIQINQPMTSIQPSSNSEYWINMTPISDTREKKNIQINGTTNLPLGSKLIVSYSMLAHSCVPPRTPDLNGQRTFCGGSCDDQRSTIQQGMYVTKGIGDENIWSTTIDTPDWCTEIYGISVKASEWTNVSRSRQYIHFGTNVSMK
jgi:hypothetical protein